MKNTDLLPQIHHLLLRLVSPLPPVPVQGTDSIILIRPEQIAYATTNKNGIFHYALHNLTSLTLKEIAHELHMNYHQVSYSSSRFEHKMKTERKYLTLWNKLLKNLTP